MAIQSLDTSFKDKLARCGDGAYYVATVNLTSTTATTLVGVPYAGELVAAYFTNGSTVMAGANNYRIGIVNASDSDAVVAASTVNGANDFGGTAYTGAFPAAYSVNEVTLGTATKVLKGDILELTATVEGTVTDGVVILYFENKQYTSRT